MHKRAQKYTTCTEYIETTKLPEHHSLKKSNTSVGKLLIKKYILYGVCWR